MEFDATREQWVDRFALRMSVLEAGTEPASFLEAAHKLWSTRGQLDPEAAANAEFELRSSAAAAPRDPFENTERFERTERIPVERVQTADEYVRDTDEWIGRCVARVLALDPIIKADEARRSVADLAELERWRLMKPEAAADQLYTPIKPRPA
ncbi:MAG: hypothetical protein ACXWCN_13325 [Caldimonas sp.]